MAFLISREPCLILFLQGPSPAHRYLLTTSFTACRDPHTGAWQGSYSPIAQRLTRTVALWQWGTELGMFVCCLSLEAGSLKLRCWQDHAPSEGTRGPALCLSQLLSPWCSLAGGSISPVSACVSPWPGSPCACLCLPSPSVSLLFW